MTDHESKQKLKKQKKELQAYVKQPGFDSGLSSQRNETCQKLKQIDEALEHEGELDPALKLNKKYRQGSRNTQAG